MSVNRKKSLAVVIGCLYFIFCCFAFSAYSQSRLIPVEVVDIHDGDTLTLKFENGFEFVGRLADIDTPEVDTEHPELSQPKGIDAKANLESLLHIEGLRMWTRSRDYYGRNLVYLVGENYLDINLAMVRNGFAWLNSVSRNNRTTYQKALADAKREKLQIWEAEKPCKPETWRKNKCPSQL
jgi:endonuclease YncB( thermonuclease family)